MGQSPAGVTRRTIARVMKRARLRAGIKSGTAARHADVSPGTLTKYEKAENPWPVPVVYVLSEFYGLSREDRDKLVELARQKELGWWHRHQEIPAWFESYIGLESEAHTVSNYEDGVIPGLLQTEDYARAILAADIDAGSDDQVEGHVTVRMQRQKRLTEESPLQFNAVFNESALYRAVGGAEVMREQLALLQGRAELPNVDLRVLPFEAGSHPAAGNSFATMQFPDLLDNVSFDDIALIEYQTGALYLESEQEVDLYARIFRQLQEKALSPEESVKRFQRVRSERFEG